MFCECKQRLNVKEFKYRTFSKDLFTSHFTPLESQQTGSIKVTKGIQGTMSLIDSNRLR